ncbi:AfsR/SARP family transcriptional regulator [Frankia sp. Cppng1_Ct_nod]|uniref:AfsR/SARP family transcriptional regulator n=1 Tax=Frankia sp. Cppng1_Ct_nod TaxID=2897162 RepID=UPI0020241F42|nr:AfsR/SARP family transcriptional regulator [Frankia sp. Cppng1_Ct_nod]
MGDALNEKALFHILGPLEVYKPDGEPVDIHQGKPRVLLSLLLLNSNTWVGIDRICSSLWEDEPPRSASGNIKTYVSQLRHALPPSLDSFDRIESRRGGYRINIIPEELDSSIFGRMADRGREELRFGTREKAIEYFEEALSLWHGQPFEELPADIALAETARLEEQRWAVWEDLMDARLALGQPEVVLPTLRALIVEYPLRERLWGQLLVALDRSGRRAEALSAYRTVYDRLANDLGIEPGIDLRRLHHQILSAGNEILTADNAADPGQPPEQGGRR